MPMINKSHKGILQEPHTLFLTVLHTSSF